MWGGIVSQESAVNPARQSLARPITDEEQLLASSLEAIFATGEHDFAAVAAELEKRKVGRPSGHGGPWTPAVLEEELRAINTSLDAAYQGTVPGSVF
jgi:hypothetical protein